MTYCPGCGWLMVGHVHLPIVRCINERCHEFDRWAAVNEKLAARVAPEPAETCVHTPADLPPAPINKDKTRGAHETD